MSQTARTARLDITTLTSWITAAAAEHPLDLADVLIERTGVSRARASKAVRQLTAMQWLTNSGTARKPVHHPGLLRQVIRRYPLQGLQEDLPWSQHFAPYFALATPIRRITQHMFCELLNNAIDHSEGDNVTVSLRQTPSHVQLLVSDDGRGLFDKLSEVFQLDNPPLAMLELSKGKLTSEPERHTGRGLFFTSRLADVFDLHANESAFQRRAWQGDTWVAGRPLPRRGTSVFAAVSLDTERTLESVMQSHSLDGTALDFERTIVPLRLLTSPEIGLDSRAQARRITNRLQMFREVAIDFRDVPDVGHGFIDELFRVQALQHPSLSLVPINMSPSVAALVRTFAA